MKAMATKAEFYKVMSFGEFDYDFSLNLSEDESKKFNFDIDQAKSIKDISPLLKNEDLCNKVQMNSQNKLINLLLFINKSNKHKSFIEFLSLNCIFLSNDLFFMKERIKSGFDEDFLFLLESNVLPPNKYKFNINVEKKAPKTFEMEFFMSDKNNDKDASKGGDSNKKPDGGKPSDQKNDNQGKDDKKGDKPSDGKPNDQNKEDKKAEDQKKDDKSKPKAGYKQAIDSIILPNAERPNFIKESIYPEPEGKDDNKTNAIDPSQINKNQQSPLILSKKRTKASPDNMGNSMLNNGLSSYPKLNLIEQLKYDFETCDYLLLDLNQYISSKNISLNELYNFIVTRIINNYLNTSIILLFPNLDNLQKENYQILIDLIAISDIVIYDKRDAIKMCNLMGYKVEEKNFEVRFMFLKELKKSKYKPHRTAMFLDDFNKLTIIVQETETNLVVFHNEFVFNVGFKVDYYKTVTDNYDMLKYAFLGGLLSRVIQNKPFDIAFDAGSQVFAKMLEGLHTHTNFSDNPDYFQVEIKKENQLEEAEMDPQLSKSLNNKYRNKSSTSKERSFVLDSTNILNSKLPSYKAANDPNLKNYFQSSNTQKNLSKLNSSSGKKPLNPNSRSQQFNQLEFIQQEQSKFLTILEQNQILQKKLVSLLSIKENQAKRASENNKISNSSVNPLSQSLNQQSSMMGELSSSRGNLPKLETYSNNPFNKLGNAPDYMRYSMEQSKKKSLKPITKEAYDRLTGTSKKDKNYGMSSMMNPQMMLMFMTMQNQIMQQQKSSSSDGKSNTDAKDKDKKPDEKKPDDKKPDDKKPDDKPTEKKNDEKTNNNLNNMFNPEFVQQYSEMMKMMGISPHGMMEQAPKKKSNYKGKNYFDKKYGKNSPFEDNSGNFSGSFNPYSMGFNPNQSIELIKPSSSKSPSRRSNSKSPEKEKPKIEEIKFEAKGQTFLADDSKTQDQLKYEEEYKKNIQEKLKKEEEQKKKKLEEERKNKEEADKMKKEYEDSSKKREEERKRKNDEEMIKKGKDAVQPDIKPKVDNNKGDGKKTEEKKSDDKKQEEKKN